MTEQRLSRQELLEAFRRQVPEVFGDLAARHRLRLGPAEESGFTLQSPRCRVGVRFGSGHVPDLNVTLAPPTGNERDDQEFGLGPVLEVVAGPGAAYASRPLRTAEDVRLELQRAAGLLETHAGRVLQGDFSAWPSLRRMVEETARDWKRQFKAGGREAHAWQARDAARTAYGQGDYGTAASLYGSIEEDLTPDERQRLERARGLA